MRPVRNVKCPSVSVKRRRVPLGARETREFHFHQIETPPAVTDLLAKQHDL